MMSANFSFRPEACKYDNVQCCMTVNDTAIVMQHCTLSSSQSIPHAKLPHIPICKQILRQPDRKFTPNAMTLLPLQVLQTLILKCNVKNVEKSNILEMLKMPTYSNKLQPQHSVQGSYRCTTHCPISSNVPLHMQQVTTYATTYALTASSIVQEQTTSMACSQPNAVKH